MVAEGKFRAKEYWSRRLGENFSLRGTGHLSYSEAYNNWLYRAKRRALAPVLDRLERGSRALDLGSGTGWVVSELLRHGLHVEGCDIAALAVERLRAQFDGVEFFELELGSEPVPRPDAAYDALTALDVLYHVTDDGAWQAALGEMARLLRPTGVVIVTDTFGDVDREPAPHVRFRSLATWQRAAAEVGLEISELRPLYRWLSRDPGRGPLSRIPGSMRGPVEYGLELAWRRTPHMSLAVLRQRHRSGRQTGDAYAARPC